MLTESLRQWKGPNGYYRPSHYQFLFEIQQNGNLLATAWPDHEEAFSLFCDLVFLRRLDRPWQHGFRTRSDGEENLYPCLLSCLDTEIVDQGYELLQYCGFPPQYSCLGEPSVSLRWTGFDRERPRPLVNDPVSKEDEWNFPLVYEGVDALGLRQLVYDSCTDWRRLHVNSGEFASPEFNIGKRERSGRWIGFIGQSTYAVSIWHPEYGQC